MNTGELTETNLIEVENLSISVDGKPHPPLVDKVSFSVGVNERVGVVGESGSGKTLTSLAISGLLPLGLEAKADKLRFKGFDLLTTPGRAQTTALGADLAMVFQDPMSSLNPALRIGTQMAESVRKYKNLSKSEARELALSSLKSVGIDSPSKRLRQRPHQLSGGMRQRVLIAMALMLKPSLIIADEPTTALDVTTQAEVMNLLNELNRLLNNTVLIVSHDIALLSEFCDRLLVMYRGRLVEELTVEELVDGPKHPYTQALLAAVPDLSTDRTIRLESINQDFEVGLGGIHA